MTTISKKNWERYHIETVLWHHNNVINMMLLLEHNRDKLPFYIPKYELIQKAVFHDLDKIEDSSFCDAIVDYHINNRNPSLDIYLEKHNAHNHKELNSHHIEYHTKNKTIPTNTDICEMICDWITASKKYYNDGKYKNIKSFWEVVYNEKYTNVKQFIDKNGIEKFKAICDLIDSFNFDDSFFGTEPILLEK